MSIQDRRAAPDPGSESGDQYPHHPKRQGGGGKRHGCLTAWLVMVIIANAYSALMGILFALEPSNPNKLGFLGFLFLPLFVWQLVCVFALFKWRKWGLWGIVAAQVVATVLQWLMVGIFTPLSLIGWIGVILLYAMLHIGGDRKAWPRLR